MAVNEKARLAKEADYIKKNDDVKSVCCGVFYNKSKKIYEPCKHCTECYKFKEYNTVKEERPQVKFHYIDSFRSCEYYKVRPIDERYIMTAITYSILYINDMACNYVQALRKGVTDSQDKELKKKYEAATRRVRRYFFIMNRLVGNKIDFFAEYNSSMDDMVDESANLMLDRIITLFKDLRIENYKFLAEIEMARTMVGMSIEAINLMVSEGRKLNEEITSLYKYKLIELRSIMEDMSRWAFRHVNCRFDMNNDVILMERFRVLLHKITNHEIVSSCLEKAEYLYG